MSISLKTRKMLWGRAANRCAFTDCRRELVVDATETDDESVIGEECHIVAESADGPRGSSPLTPDQRDKYGNLILLCSVHHKNIDDQSGYYTVEYLHQLKDEHEAWVRSKLTYDPTAQRDDEYYADLIQQFCEKIDIDHWQNWSSWIMCSGYPRISLDIHDKLESLRGWLLSRVWPLRYPEIENSIHNFRLVLQDFMNMFNKHSEPHGEEMLGTKRFYKISEWDPERYERLSNMHEFHVDLVQDLMLELTRAANYVCDMVRKRFFPAFRLQEGVLLVTSGPYMDLTYRTHRAEYRGEERIEKPYPGLAAFKEVREQRDFYFGHGSVAEIDGLIRG